MKDKNSKNFQSLQSQISNSVSLDFNSAKEYLNEENVDIDYFTSKGIKAIQQLENKKKNKSLFFKRVVLATEIINNLHREITFGHVKLQKLMYLCEEVSNMEVTRRYVKQAAGPYDRKFMHSIDKELVRLKWFKVEVSKHNGYQSYKYFPDSKLNSYKSFYENYFNENINIIKWLIKTFKNNPTSKVELVATIYYCLNEFKVDNNAFNEENLIKRVFDWSIEKKKKFTKKDIVSAYNWMQSKKLFPA